MFTKQQLCEQNLIIEIDESKLFRMKYGAGRILSKHRELERVIGRFETTTNLMTLMFVEYVKVNAACGESTN